MSLFDKIKNSIKSSSNENNFKYLSKLIQKEKEIYLDRDIILDDEEIEDFINGIEISQDNLTINGNGHFIDARNKVRIFEISGQSIVLKNIIFRDSYVQYMHGGAIKNSSQKLIIQNCIFENSSTQWDGGAIDNDGSLLIENSIFKNNFSKRGGGAISSSGELKIINCEFEFNHCDFAGGCIYAKNIVSIENTTFKDNSARNAGCINIYYTSTVSIKDSTFINDNDGDYEFISVDNCDLNMKNSHLWNNGQSGGLTARWSKLNIEESTFKENLKAIGTTECDLTLLKNKFINNKDTIFTDSYLNIQECEFSGENKGNFTIMLKGNEDSRFNVEKNLFESSSSRIIYLTEGYCISKYNKFKIKDNYAIFNENGEIEIKKDNYMVEDENNQIEVDINNEKFNIPSSKIIYNNHILKTEEQIGHLIENGPDSKVKAIKEELPEDVKGFSHLEDLINTNDEINLEYDISLHESEKDFFEGGIEINRDNLKINGNGHVIDACEFSRIFYITSNNITLENIIFKNGKYFKNKLDDSSCGGAAIYLLHNSSLKLINCTFKDNSSRQSSGAIKSNGDRLTIIDSEFENNVAHNGNSGAIYNKKGDLTIESSQFVSNHSEGCAGAIYNKDGILNILSCEFKDNYVKEEFFREIRGGAVYNENGELYVANSNFYENKSFKGGGIFNAGVSFKIDGCHFSENHAEEGGSIYNLNNESMVYNCSFENNESDGAIYNKEGLLNIKESKFNDNFSTHNGGALYNNKGEINIRDSDFESNKAIWGQCGGAIGSFYGTFNLENCRFSKNSARNGGVIDSYGGKWIISNCDFVDNSSEWKGGVILNREKGSLNISNSNFYNNESKTATDIYNIEGEMELFKCEFKNNEKLIILNKDTIVLMGCKLENHHEIFNLNNAKSNILK